MVDAAQLSAGELDQVVTKAAEMKGPLLVQKYAFLFLERLAERNWPPTWLSTLSIKRNSEGHYQRGMCKVERWRSITIYTVLIDQTFQYIIGPRGLFSNLFRLALWFPNAQVFLAPLRHLMSEDQSVTGQGILWGSWTWSTLSWSKHYTQPTFNQSMWSLRPLSTFSESFNHWSSSGISRRSLLFGISPFRPMSQRESIYL